MKRLEAKEGKCLRSRCERLGDKRGGTFHSVDIPGDLMKDFRGVAKCSTLAGSASREEGSHRSTHMRRQDTTVDNHSQGHLGNELGVRVRMGFSTAFGVRTGVGLVRRGG